VSVRFQRCGYLRRVYETNKRRRRLQAETLTVLLVAGAYTWPFTTSFVTASRCFPSRSAIRYQRESRAKTSPLFVFISTYSVTSHW